VVIETQVYAYASPIVKPAGHAFALLAALSLGSISITVALSWALQRAPSWFSAILGDTLPPILIGAGFLPQMHQFFATKSIDGYSFGVTAFDVIGSLANASVIFAVHGVTTDFFIKAGPFLVIIALHAVLIAIALGIVCCSKRCTSDDVQV
jgi:hypothetical protein